MKSDYNIDTELDNAYKQYIQKPGPDTSAAFLKVFEPDMKSAVNNYTQNSSPAMLSKAKKLTLQALPTYKPESGPIRPYLRTRLQELARIARHHNRVDSVPDRVLQQQAALHRIELELEDELERSPSAQELADRSGIPLKRIEYINKYQKPVLSSTIMGRDSDGGVSTFEDAGVEMDDHLDWVKQVHVGVGPVDQSILEHHYGLYGKPRLTNQEIAKRLRISPSAVTQRTAKLQAILDDRKAYGL